MTRLLQMDIFNGVDCTGWRHQLGNQKFGCLDGTRYTGRAVVRLAVSRQPLDQLSLVRAVPPLSSSSMLRPLTEKVREGEAVRAAVEAEQPELAAKLRADMREAARGLDSSAAATRSRSRRCSRRSRAASPTMRSLSAAPPRGTCTRTVARV